MAADTEVPTVPEVLALGLNDGILVQHLGDESGRGRGIVAQRRFSRGERILHETPLILISSTQKDEMEAAEDGSLEALILGRLHECTSADSKTFWDLEDSRCKRGEKTAAGIFLTNKIEVMELSGGDEIVGETSDEMAKERKGLFLLSSFFNHSCRPNVFWSERADLGEIVFHALHDVEPEVELTIAYSQASLSMPTGMRQKLLRSWDFSCNCLACVVKDDLQLASDERRALLNLKMRQLGSGPAKHVQELGNDEEIKMMQRKIEKDPLQGLAIVRELITLLDEELLGHAPTKSWAALEGFVLAERAFREDLALEMLELGLAENCVAEGEDSENSLALAAMIEQRKVHIRLAKPKAKTKRSNSRTNRVVY